MPKGQVVRSTKWSPAGGCRRSMWDMARRNPPESAATSRLSTTSSSERRAVDCGKWAHAEKHLVPELSRRTCMNRHVLTGLCLSVMLSATHAFAHHSFAATYLEEESVTIEG